jgi:hypothetical protein
MLRVPPPEIGDVRRKAHETSSPHRRKREVRLHQQTGFPDDARHRSAKLAFA